MLTLCHPWLRLLHTQLGGFGSLSILYGALGALRVAFPASGSTFASNAWLASIILAVVFFFANVGPNSTTYVVAMETPEKYVRGCVAGLSAALAKLSAAGAFSMFVLIGDPSSGGNMSYVGGLLGSCAVVVFVRGSRCMRLAQVCVRCLRHCLCHRWPGDAGVWAGVLVVVLVSQGAGVCAVAADALSLACCVFFASPGPHRHDAGAPGQLHEASRSQQQEWLRWISHSLSQVSSRMRPASPVVCLLTVGTVSSSSSSHSNYNSVRTGNQDHAEQWIIPFDQLAVGKQIAGIPRTHAIQRETLFACKLR